MYLKSKRIQLLAALALSVPFLELVLGWWNVALHWRVLALAGLAATILLLAVRELKQVSKDLASIRNIIDLAARGEFDREIPVPKNPDAFALAAAVGKMRLHIAELARKLADSVRTQSLNLLGSVLVHDIRNISFRLHSMSRNLEDNYDDPGFRESLSKAMTESAKQMDQLVLRFRTEKKMVTVKSRTDLNEITARAMRNVRNSGASLRITEEYGDLPLVWADPMLIENAFFNIIENAREAMPNGGSIAVRTHLSNGVQHGERRAVIEITDSGPGMTDDFIQRNLFAPFVTTKPRGLGVGLHTSREIVRMHDGEIIVKSTPGLGTIFRVLLPVGD